MNRNKAGMIAFALITFFIYAFGLHFFEAVWSFPAHRAIPFMVVALVGTGASVAVTDVFDALFIKPKST